MLTEQKVLKKLGIEDFRYLTKDKVVKMANMLDKMNPEVAKKAIEQFPNFSNTMKEILAEYKIHIATLGNFLGILDGVTQVREQRTHFFFGFRACRIGFDIFL